MIHARQDYNRIQDPAVLMPELLPEGGRSIGIDEPVFLLRAQDENMVEMLNTYYNLVVNKAPEVAACLDEFIPQVEAWQAKNGCKTPDL